MRFFETYTRIVLRMKFICFILGFLLCCGCSITVVAQLNTIKIAGASAVAGRLSIGYERTFGQVVSFHVGFDSGPYAIGTVNGERDYTLKGMHLITELRVYPFQNMMQAPNGFFIGEGFRYSEYDDIYKDVFGSYGRPASVENSIFKNLYILTGYKFNYGKFSIESTLGYGLMDQANFNEFRYQIPLLYRNSLQESGNGFIDEKGMIRLRIFMGYTFPKLNKEKRKKEQTNNS